MEPISKSTNSHKKSLVDFPDAKAMWQYAKEYVLSFRSSELENFWSVVLKASQQEVTEHFFVREHMWCVMVAGFSAATIAKKFPDLLIKHRIEDQNGKYRKITPETLNFPLEEVLAVFGNRRKAEAILKMRQAIYEQGWETLWGQLNSRTPEVLNGLPGIGPVLACHLARNLGNLNIVKPDVHLTRLAKKYGFKDTVQMCKELSDEPIGRTDLILWLACVDNTSR